jgi:hypothetical protein
VAAKSGNFFKQSEIELELAELWKDTETDTAIYYYECSLKSSKKAKNYQNIILAHRNLGEIFIQTAETEGVIIFFILYSTISIFRGLCTSV